MDHSELELSVGGGYVAEDSDPLNVYPSEAVENGENPAPYVPPVDQPLSDFRLTSSFNYKYEGTGPPSETYRNSIKEAVLERGAVSADMFVGSFADFYNAEHHTYQAGSEAASESANHLIVIAGWDDNQSVYDPEGNVIGTGAWLVQNSWGEDFGDGGYFWIGYGDIFTATAADSFVAADRSVADAPGWTYTETISVFSAASRCMHPCLLRRSFRANGRMEPMVWKSSNVSVQWSEGPR